ncbi:DUF6011 domain-containing protein [Solidesulfovibrio sp.]
MNACAICHRPLTDKASRERGVGPDCWVSVLGKVTRDQGKKLPVLGAFAGNVILVRVDGRPYTNISTQFTPLECSDFSGLLSWGVLNAGALTLALNILSKFLLPSKVKKVGLIPDPQADVLAPYFAKQFLEPAPYAGAIIMQHDILKWLRGEVLPGTEILTYGVLA